MVRNFGNDIVVLAGHGFDEVGPYLAFNNQRTGNQSRFHVHEKTFSLRRLPRRRCVGRFDLGMGTRSVCPLDVELLPESKDDMCPACQEATGFNPSFYFSEIVSPQQRAYNLTPHTVYLAYFSPHHVKAGITAEARGVNRLVEQGARSARIVGRFADAYQARDLEAALVAQPGIFETMRQAKKVELLVGERYDPTEAVAVLDKVTAQLASLASIVDAGFSASEPVQELSHFYFVGPSPSSEDLQMADGDPAVCGGRCVGMIGDVLVFEQQGANFLAALKGWESHEVDLLKHEVICEYRFMPQQMSLL